jgi:hypothetical protein
MIFIALAPIIAATFEPDSLVHIITAFEYKRIHRSAKVPRLVAFELHAS